MGTSDLNCSLFGHLFNSYNETYIKEELRPLSARFLTAQTQDERCTRDDPVLSDEETRMLAAATGRA